MRLKILSIIAARAVRSLMRRPRMWRGPLATRTPFGGASSGGHVYSTILRRHSLLSRLANHADRRGETDQKCLSLRGRHRSCPPLVLSAIAFGDPRMEVAAGIGQP